MTVNTIKLNLFTLLTTNNRSFDIWHKVRVIVYFAPRVESGVLQAWDCVWPRRSRGLETIESLQNPFDRGSNAIFHHTTTYNFDDYKSCIISFAFLIGDLDSLAIVTTTASKQQDKHSSHSVFWKFLYFFKTCNCCL